MGEYDRRNGGHRGGHNNRKRRFRGDQRHVPLLYCNLRTDPVVSQRTMTSIAGLLAANIKSLRM